MDFGGAQNFTESKLDSLVKNYIDAFVTNFVIIFKNL